MMAEQFLKEVQDAGVREPAEMRLQAIRWVEKLFPNVEPVTTGTLQQWMEEKPEEVLLLDTRTPAEFEVSHLEGAVLLSPEPDALAELFTSWLAEERGGRRRHIVCYCTVGYRSSTAAQLLNGLLSRETFPTPSKAYNMQGGLVKWATERRQMVDRREKPTHLVHPYSVIWAKLLEPEFRAEM